MVAAPFRQGKHYPVQSGPAPTTASCFKPGSVLGEPFSSDPVGIEVYTPGPKAPPEIQQMASSCSWADFRTLETWVCFILFFFILATETGWEKKNHSF